MVSIIPKPLEVKELNGKLKLDKNIAIEENSLFPKTVKYLKELFNCSGNNIMVSFVKDESFKDEEYSLTIDNSIIIKANKDIGAYYAYLTLAQIIPIDFDLDKGFDIDKVYIHDLPEFEYRSFMLDVCRHFFTKDDVFKYIDQMAKLKYNVFHFHLSDDQGFRLDLKKYPKLKEISSKRAQTIITNNFNPFVKKEYDGIPHEGYYTEKDIKEILKFASDRFIKVIPEIDCPGHTTAINAAYPEYLCNPRDIKVKEEWGIAPDVMCIGNENTIPFIKDIIVEVSKLFETDVVHIGGDECPTITYKKCPKCQAYMKEHNIKNVKDLQASFTINLSLELKKAGIQTIVWDEAISNDMPSDTFFQYWRGKYIKKNFDCIKNGHKVIASPFFNYYLDYVFPLFDLKDTYNFDPYYTKHLGKEFKNNVYGVEAPLWCEHVKTLDKAFFQAFPRAIAVIEAGWTKPELKNYEDFLNRLEVYLKRLDKDNITYSPKECYMQKRKSYLSLLKYAFSKYDFASDTEYKKYRGNK